MTATKWLRHKEHISVHIGIFSTGILSGAVLVRVVEVPKINYVWLLVAVAVFAVSIRRARRIWLLGTLFAGVIFGLGRGGYFDASLGSYASFYGTEVTVRGVVAGDPSVNSAGKPRLTLKSIEIDGVSLVGVLTANIQSLSELRRGDKVVLIGTVSKGFGNSSATLNGVEIIEINRASQVDIALGFRDWFAESVRKNIAEPAASLGLGFLVGQRGTLPKTLEDELRMLGLTHIVVASGYNLTILMRFARKRLMRISRYTALVGSLGLVAGFIAVAGFSPSMNRAGLVAVFSLLAWYYGRRMNPLLILALVGAITVFANPSYIWGDIGWYLSFLSFFGVLVVGPLIRNYFFADKEETHFLRDVLIETTAAQIMTLPIIVFVFGQYSPLALLANVLVLPTIPFAMLFTFLGGLFSGIFPPIGEIASVPAELLIGYITSVVSWLSRSPYANGELTIGSWGLAAAYIFILAVVFWMYSRTKDKKLEPYI